MDAGLQKPTRKYTSSVPENAQNENTRQPADNRATIIKKTLRAAGYTVARRGQYGRFITTPYCLTTGRRTGHQNGFLIDSEH